MTRYVCILFLMVMLKMSPCKSSSLAYVLIHGRGFNKISEHLYLLDLAFRFESILGNSF